MVVHRVDSFRRRPTGTLEHFRGGRLTDQRCLGFSRAERNGANPADPDTRLFNHTVMEPNAGDRERERKISRAPAEFTEPAMPVVLQDRQADLADHFGGIERGGQD